MNDKLKILFVRIFLRPFYESPFVFYRTRRTRCLLWQGDKLVLVRHSTGSKLLSLPGGGLKRKETIVENIIRELGEELEVSNLENIQHIGTIQSNKGLNVKTYEIMMARIRMDEKLVPNYEILEISPQIPQNIDWGETDELVKQALELS